MKNKSLVGLADGDNPIKMFHEKTNVVGYVNFNQIQSKQVFLNRWAFILLKNQGGNSHKTSYANS